MRPFELLIFDWDGTVGDSAAQIVAAMHRAILGLGLPSRSDEVIRDLIGLSLAEGLTRLFPEIETGQLMALLDGYRRHFVGSGHSETPLFAGTLESLETLHGLGYRLAVATGKSRAGLRRALEHHRGVRLLLSSSRTADETAPKPHPLMLQELLEEEQLRPEQALMIGDTVYDAEMARALGMPMLGVACGVHEPGRIIAAGALAVLDNVAAVPGWLSSRQRQAGFGQ